MFKRVIFCVLIFLSQTAAQLQKPCYFYGQYVRCEGPSGIDMQGKMIISVGGLIMPPAAVLGKVLTTDNTGFATWQAPQAVAPICSIQTKTCVSLTTCTVTCPGATDRVTSGGCTTPVTISAHNGVPTALNAFTCTYGLAVTITSTAICCAP